MGGKGPSPDVNHKEEEESVLQVSTKRELTVICIPRSIRTSNLFIEIKHTNITGSAP